VARQVKATVAGVLRLGIALHAGREASPIVAQHGGLGRAGKGSRALVGGIKDADGADLKAGFVDTKFTTLLSFRANLDRKEADGAGNTVLKRDEGRVKRTLFYSSTTRCKREGRRRTEQGDSSSSSTSEPISVQEPSGWSTGNSGLSQRI
jgi:hypothetical protein